VEIVVILETLLDALVFAHEVHEVAQQHHESLQWGSPRQQRARWREDRQWQGHHQQWLELLVRFRHHLQRKVEVPLNLHH
jgi:hypothetical protein